MVMLLFISIGFVGCSKDDSSDDVRDKYLGPWSTKTVGNLTLYHDGQVLVTVPLEEEGSTHVFKSGEKDLKIGDKIYIVNGNRLTGEVENFSSTQDGFNMVGTSTYSGNLGDNIITINSDVTGTWSGEGLTGNFSGEIVIVMTK